ncbi:restriction endonuclease subunit S [Marinobacter sp.]|uniref:restriction endonuclease subunit S n=1 Tax=Marinobacter sp. TaxID=50741 RepID=UPI0035C72112
MSENYLSELMLGDVAHIIDPHPSHRAPPEVREGVPFAGIGDISEAGELLPGKGRVVSKGVIYEHSLRYKISSNTVGFGRVASIGKVIDFRRNEENLAISPTMAIVEPFDIDKDFLIAALQGSLVRGKIDQWLTGSTRSSLGIELLREVPIPSFDKEAQKKIGAIYRSIVSTIEKTEALIAKYQQIKAGLMLDFFTRGIGRDGKLRPPREQAPELYQETPAGWIPKEWGLARLEQLLAPVANNLRSGPFGSALLKSELVEDGIPFLGIDNIHIELFVDNFRRFVSGKKFLELNKYAVRKKDVIITIMGTVGRSAVVPEHIDRALSSKHLWTMTFDQECIVPELVCWQLNYAPWVKSWFRRETQGGIMDAIQSRTLKTLTLPVPPLTEQLEIAKRYTALSDRIGLEEQTLEKLKKQKSGLMHDLLTGDVPVYIDTEEGRAVETA